MINITTNTGLTFSFPQSYKETTIKQFQQMNEIKDNDEDGVKVISILSGIDEDLLIKINYTEFLKLKAMCNFKPISNELIPMFELDGIEYGYRFNPSEMNTSEFIDYTTFSKEETMTENLHILMAILYRPIVKKLKSKDINNYIIEDYDANSVMERALLFQEKCSVDLIISAMLFSMGFYQAFVEHMNQSSQNHQIKAQMTKNTNESIKKVTLMNMIKKLKKKKHGV